MEKNNDWIIDNLGCTHHMIGDKDKFTTIKLCYEGSMKFRNGSPYMIKGKGIINLADDIICDEFYWVNGL